ncbi:carboxyl-terminal peptidase [Medicago truncatula]|uniref:Carboxyl-terminal peptidase n=1 Tax=Medicago truncatula TaxID=3880 RepID=A0A072VA93_MEDTR|nr:carboxyl-terminal peptidase [Medicago truncatula]
MHCFVAYCLASETSNHPLANQTFRSEETHKLKKMITSRLQQINKPAVKTIQSPDGDIIDCVVSHKQPAFDHPLLKGQKPLDPQERPRGHNQTDLLSDNFQLWSLSGESCPEGSVPIRRTKEEDILRASSINTFGRKLNQVGMDTTKYKHVHSTGYVTGDLYYGAKATINLWSPHVEGEKEFSLSQIWLTTGRNSNTIEAGWQVSHQIYGDYLPRSFVYWTADAYKETGCYNLRCSGFVQTSKTFTLGGALSPSSTYNGRQLGINLLIYKVIFLNIRGGI